MKEHADWKAQEPKKEAAAPTDRAVAGRSPGADVSPRQVLALQQMAGNRAAARTVARWTAHPDKDKKGVFLPDAVALEYLRFNPPNNE